MRFENYPSLITDSIYENGPFTDDLPIRNSDVPWLCELPEEKTKNETSDI